MPNKAKHTGANIPYVGFAKMSSMFSDMLARSVA